MNDTPAAPGGGRPPGGGTGFVAFRCPRCMAETKVLASMAGRSTKCPKCTKTVQVPGERRRPAEAAVEKAKAGEGEAAQADEGGEHEQAPARTGVARDEGRRERSTFTVPPVLRGFGLVLGLGSLLGLGQGVVTLFGGWGFGLPGVIQLAFAAYLGKLALDLREGRRSAVVGLGIVFLFLLPLDLLVLHFTHAPAEVWVVTIGLRLLLLGTPALIGFTSWSRLQ